VNEQEAVHRLRLGDIRALEALVRAHQVRAVRTAYLVTHDRNLAEEIVQSAFVRAYERIHQLAPEKPFAPWFLTSVLRDSIKAATRRSRFVSDEDAALSLSDGALGPETLWERAETADEIWDALRQLTPEQRAAVVARYYLDLNQAEMAETLRCSVSTVKWRLHAARARLRVLLTPLFANQ
jgi:RNA polymerase sigma-70 factor (ECF subfamily)